MNTTGIDYFPCNSNFYQDDKVQLVESRHGIAGSSFAHRLLCKVYNLDGYYCVWNDDICHLMERQVAKEVNAKEIDRIVHSLAEFDFFDADMLEKHGILTSRGIQRRYMEAKKRNQSFEMRGDYLLALDDAKKYSNLRIVYDTKTPETVAAGITQQPAQPVQVPHHQPEDIAPVQAPTMRRRSRSQADQRQDASQQEVENDKIVLFFFSQNFVNPNAEFEKFRRWNDRKHMESGGWDAIPSATRQGMAVDWKQDPPGQSRFPKMFLDMWLDAYSSLSRHDAPFAVLHDMLRDDIKLTDDAVGMGSDTKWIYTITCTKIVSDYLQANRIYLPENMKKLIENGSMKFSLCS